MPLSLDPLGALTSSRFFDDLTSTSEDFKFKSLKGAFVWKTRVETYLISRFAAMAQILYWAEREESVISPERLQEAAGDGLVVVESDSHRTDHTEA